MEMGIVGRSKRRGVRTEGWNCARPQLILASRAAIRRAVGYALNFFCPFSMNLTACRMYMTLFPNDKIMSIAAPAPWKQIRTAGIVTSGASRDYKSNRDFF